MSDDSILQQEVRTFAVLHSRAQQLNEKLLQCGLQEIARDDPDNPATWTAVWTRLADAAAARGETLEAVKLYNLARFPFIDGPERQMAHKRCVECFGQWTQNRAIERWNFSAPDFSAYATGLDRNRPVVIVTGGIVSIKEQWHALLSLASVLGRCVVVTEMPCVGENRAPYDPVAPLAYGRILERLRDRADISRVHLLAFSFSGHLALRAAIHDSRIRRVTTVGAPIHFYFGDRNWHERLPLLTRMTLATMLGCRLEELFERTRDWALTPGELSAVNIPVDYLASARDEIIPAAEYDFLKENLGRLRLLLVDDVHGSPNHARLTALWVATCLLHGCGTRGTWKAWLASRLLGSRIRQAGARMVTA